METTCYLIIVAFLLVLAVVDLFVGVSNDAVNFLNSAIGQRWRGFAPFSSLPRWESLLEPCCRRE